MARGWPRPSDTTSTNEPRQPHEAPPPDLVADAAKRIDEAERPLIIVGAGARDDMASIIEMAERPGAPVATTFKTKGQISDAHPLGCGVLGRSGTPVASWFMTKAT